MDTRATEAGREVSELVRKALSSARYLVNAAGGKTDVVISLEAWNCLLELLEELDDREIVRRWLPRLEAGPAAAGALRWSDVEDEWDAADGEPV